MIDMVEEYKKQHIENYRNAILEIIRNNTTVLMEEDILSLLKKPPLDSMDAIKSKFLTTAKKYKLVLDTKKLDQIIDSYRHDVIPICEELKASRIDFLTTEIEDFFLKNSSEIVRLPKKSLVPINKKLKKQLKDKINLAVTKNIVEHVNQLFTKNEIPEKEEKAISEISKYLLGPYSKQLLENVDFKVLVKDTTLINGIKEQGERYLFTLENSHIFNQ